MPPLFQPAFPTLQSARLELQRKTGRPMAKLGRLPLKDYLEVSANEYLSARKTGRSAYGEWLDPLVRLAKQDPTRVRACCNFVEFHHPLLSVCEGQYKARQLLQQIIDNAIDENTNAKKKAVKGETGGGGGGGSGGGAGGNSASTANGVSANAANTPSSSSTSSVTNRRSERDRDRDREGSSSFEEDD